MSSEATSSSRLPPLRWEDVDLAGNALHVRRGYDDRAGVIEPKSRAGQRQDPIAAKLRAHLAAHALRAEGSDGYVFLQAGTATRSPRASFTSGH